MARVTPAPIDPETGFPVRNWPCEDDMRKRPKRRPPDDKDAQGEWTVDAIVRLGGCIPCRTVFFEDCTCGGFGHY